jgi:hypothetical protein
MKSASFSLRRVGLIAGNTMREAVRQRIAHFLLLLALALAGGARWLRDFNFGVSELKFLADCGFGAMTFFGSALTIAATAQLFFSEIENRTALTLLAKPVRRGEFVVGKLTGVAALVAGFCGMLTVLIAVMLWWRERQLGFDEPESTLVRHAISYPAVFAAGFLQWLKLVVLAAWVLLVATFARTQLFTMATGFFVLVICHLQYLAHDAYVRGGSMAGRSLGRLLTWTFPNFQFFDLTAAIDGNGFAWAHVERIGIYGAGYAVVLAALAVFSFRQREI